MRTHGNTLYATTQGLYLGIEGEAVTAKQDGSVKMRVPIHMLDGIVCFGRVSCSPYLLARCADRGVGVSFLTERGRFLARMYGAVSGNVLLRVEQVRRADDHQKAAELVRSFVAGKLLNSRAVLARSLRDHGDRVDRARISAVVDRLAHLAALLPNVAEVDRLRGVEGEGARLYFGVFNDLILADDPKFRFAGRNRRPPLDRINALLSFLYTLLVHDVSSALQAVGLDPQIGYLHALRPGRPSLALDMQEEFRSFLADRVALSLVNRRQLTNRDFAEQPTGAVHLSESGRRTVLRAWQDRKTSTIRHRFLDEETTVGRLPHLQAKLLAKALRGDLDGYPPFVVR